MRTRQKLQGKRQKEENRVFFFVFFAFFPKGLLLFFFGAFLIFNFSFAQQPSPIHKSDKTETIDGKKFYIHTVEKGQTLYSIAKTYSTTVDIVLANNTEAVDGLKAGDRLKIPFIGKSPSLPTVSIVEEKKKGLPVLTPESEKKSVSNSNKDSVKEIPNPNPQQGTVQTSKENLPGLPVKPIGDIHVALFLPLSLSMVNAIDVGKIAQGEEPFPEETKTGIEFYEGVKMAFDSLKKEGFKGNLHVYDSNLDSAGFAKLLKKTEMKEMDLIIGPLNGRQFETVLKFAKLNNINIVAPTIQSNNMLMGNPNVSKVTPSFATQSEILANYVSEKFAGQNILVFNSANPKDKPYINTFKRTANATLQKAKADSVKEITFVTLNTFFSKTKPNIVVIPSTNQSFISEAVNRLYQDKQENNKDSILVFGMSNWIEMESLDFNYLKKLYATVSCCTFTDYLNPGTKKFIGQYRNEYKTDPTGSVFSGFDIGYFYLGGLQKFGNDLQRKLPELKHKGIQTEFNFTQADPSSTLGPGSGYENKGVGIMKFENYSYIRVK